MKKSDWRKVKNAVEKALEIGEGKRQRFIEDFCAETPELIGEVESLLECEIESEGFFDSFREDVISGFADEDLEKEKLIGQIIEKYRIVKKIGRGGMGEVYLAERSDGTFEQKVAIKLIRQRNLGSHTIRRFLAEQQILASLNHPNIAKLLDGGFTKRDEPFIVMEYVVGKPLLKYIADENPTLDKRLKLFLKICSAISFAHSNLIIHRDIKPANVLVKADGEPILLDFGLGKILAEDFNENNLPQNQTKFHAFTLAYASPEQIGEKIVSTQTDVYSLGVLLYEMLTGFLPFQTDGKTLVEVLRTIDTAQPQNPSDAAKREFDKNENNSTSDKLPAESRCTTQSLKGDLDVIILKAIRREPERRYQSVEKFADDIERHLNNLPIRARPATISYRFTKFFERNKAAVFSAVLIFISLIAGTVIAVWQADAAQKQAQVAAIARSKAEFESQKSKSEEEKARKITAFMEKILSYANPGFYDAGGESKGEAKVIDVIDELSGNIEKEFPDQTEIQAELHHKFAEIYVMMSHPDLKHPRAESSKSKALYHAENALKLRKQVYGEKNELIATDLFYVSKALEHNGKDNLKTLDQALKIMRETNSQSEDFPHILAVKAETLRSRKLEAEKSGKPSEIKWSEIEKLFLEALPLFQKHYKDSSYLNALIYADLWITAVHAEDSEKIDEYRRQTKAGIEKLTNKDEIKFILERIEGISALEAELSNRKK